MKIVMEKIKATSFALLLVVLCTNATGQTKSSNSNDELREAAKLTQDVIQLFAQKKYEEALPLAKRVVELREKSLTAQEEPLRSAWKNLAEVYIALNKNRDAETYLNRYIKSYDPAADDPSLIDVWQRMALVQFAIGMLDKAEAGYQKAVQIAEKRFGVDSPQVARALAFVGEFHQVRTDYKKAEPFYSRALAIWDKRSDDKSSLDFISAVQRYSCLLGKMGRKDESQQIQEQYFKRTLGADGIVVGESGGKSDSASADRLRDQVVRGGVLNGRAVNLPKPNYPAEALASRASGTVVVHVLIDERGQVVHACAVSGARTLLQVSENAAYRSSFTPTKLSGMPVKVSGIITYNFVRR